MAAPATVEKKTIIGAKVTPDKKKRILGRCEGLKCNTTDYIMALIDKDLDDAVSGPAQAVQAAVLSTIPKGRLAVKDGSSEKEIVRGRVRGITYVIDGEKPAMPIKAVEVDGKRFKYCEQCRKFVRKGDDGKDEFWSP